MQKCIVVCVFCNICTTLSDCKKKKKATVQKKSEVLASFVSFCKVVWFLAWNRSRTSLDWRHRLAWDYFSVLQLWIEIIAIPCYHIVLAQSSTYILLSVQVHLATITPKLDNWLCRLLTLVRTLVRRWFRGAPFWTCCAAVFWAVVPCTMSGQVAQVVDAPMATTSNPRMSLRV